MTFELTTTALAQFFAAVWGVYLLLRGLEVKFDVELEWGRQSEDWRGFGLQHHDEQALEAPNQRQSEPAESEGLPLLAHSPDHIFFRTRKH